MDLEPETPQPTYSHPNTSLHQALNVALGRTPIPTPTPLTTTNLPPRETGFLRHGQPVLAGYTSVSSQEGDTSRDELLQDLAKLQKIHQGGGPPSDDDLAGETGFFAKVTCI